MIGPGQAIEQAEREFAAGRDSRQPEIDALETELVSRTHERDAAGLGKDAAYTERNRCVAAIARMALTSGWRAGLGRHQPAPDPNWDPEWLTVVYIDLPTGQVSWHLHDRDVALFVGLPAYDGEWDGHSTEEKYARLAALFGGGS